MDWETVGVCTSVRAWLDICIVLRKYIQLTTGLSLCQQVAMPWRLVGKGEVDATCLTFYIFDKYMSTWILALLETHLQD